MIYKAREEVNAAYKKFRRNPVRDNPVTPEEEGSSAYQEAMKVACMYDEMVLRMAVAMAGAHARTPRKLKK